MKEQIKKHITEELKKLKYKGDMVKLNNVNPSILEDVLGDFIEPYDLNGYDCDYWAKTDEYEIFGTMRFATAQITLVVGEEKPKEDKIIKDIKEEKQSPVILRIKDVPSEELENLNTYYFTFGNGQMNEGHYQPIMAKDRSTALKKMNEIYGRKWAFDYDEKTWKSAKKYYVGKGLESIIVL